MKCKECDGKGFKEYEHGLIQVECGICGGTGEIDEEKALNDLRGRIYDSSSGTELDNQPAGKPTYLILPEALPDKTMEETVEIARELIEVSKNDSGGRTGRVDKPIGSTDTGKSKQQKKPRAKKKTRARAG